MIIKGPYLHIVILLCSEWRFSSLKRTVVEKIQKLVPTKAAIIADNISDYADADKHLKERLPIIKCECGAEILLLPDLKAMNRAIKAHGIEHKKKKRIKSNSIIASSNICQLLSQLSLIKISAQNDT